MKKKIQYLLMCLALTLGSVCLVSCGDDDEVKPEAKNECVDLGLSVKWASCNLGASKPEEYGDYYGWGCTEPYAEDGNVNWTLYFQMLGVTGVDYSVCGKAKDPLLDYVYPNLKSLDGTKYDAAYVKLGGKWRMPRKSEIFELVTKTTTEWTTLNGVCGYKLTSKKNGNSIFLPAAGYRIGGTLYDGGSYGYYWSSTPLSYFTAYAVGFNSMNFAQDDRSRLSGYVIRPVSGE